MAALDGTPHLPGRHAIERFGAGGFRFAEMSHRGSLLILPSGIWAWPVRTPQDVDDAALARVFAEADDIDFSCSARASGSRRYPSRCGAGCASGRLRLNRWRRHTRRIPTTCCWPNRAGLPRA